MWPYLFEFKRFVQPLQYLLDLLAQKDHSGHWGSDLTTETPAVYLCIGGKVFEEAFQNFDDGMPFELLDVVRRKLTLLLTVANAIHWD